MAEVKGAKKTAFSDTKVITGTQYTYSVKAFKNTKGKKTFSSYNKKGVTTIAGLYTLKLNSSRITLNPGKSYTLKVNGTKLTPAWRSSNSKIVTVNKKGRITAKKAGTAKITARLGGKKFVCTVCGYVFEGEAAPAECPVCHAGADKFKEQVEGEKEWAAEHVVGVAKGVSEDILADLRANFEGECSEVGMYLAMARVAHREGYPEIGLYW